MTRRSWREFTACVAEPLILECAGRVTIYRTLPAHSKSESADSAAEQEDQDRDPDNQPIADKDAGGMGLQIPQQEPNRGITYNSRDDGANRQSRQTAVR